MFLDLLICVDLWKSGSWNYYEKKIEAQKTQPEIDFGLSSPDGRFHRRAFILHMVPRTIRSHKIWNWRTNGQGTATFGNAGQFKNWACATEVTQAHHQDRRNAAGFDYTVFETDTYYTLEIDGQ